MYACLHQPPFPQRHESTSALLEFAYSFAPFVEQAASTTVLFSIAALKRTIGPPGRIASTIAELQKQQSLDAKTAIAYTPDAAILLAHYSEQNLVVATADDAGALATLPLAVLFEHDRSLPPEMLPLLQSWGLSRCGDLAQLPEAGVAERLGAAGEHLCRLALGQLQRPLRVTPFAPPYQEQVQLEHALDSIEPLLFLASRTLANFCERLRSQMMAARTLAITLHLDRSQPHQRTLEFAVPLQDHRAMLKLLQLDLDRHSPSAPVIGFTLCLEAVAPRCIQHHLLLPPAPAPDKLQLTLSRIAAVVGEGNIGTPELLNTFRPDAFRLLRPSDEGDRRSVVQNLSSSRVKLALRIFRPAVPVRVRLQNHMPVSILSSAAAGSILRAAGPWQSSGEWWTRSRWATDEWDIALENGAVYCLSRDMSRQQWFLRGVYD
jgi:protein ImuB